MTEIQQMIDDFAMVTYLKKNSFTHHHYDIKNEAMNRIREYGAKLAEAEANKRHHEQLKQNLAQFEILHPEVVSKA